MLTDQKEQRKKVGRTLHRPPPSESPDIEPADTPLQVKIPDDWKKSYLIKLPKKGDLKEFKN